MMVKAAGIRFRYPRSKTNALDGAGFVADSGAALAVLGPNGSGKSTLLRVVAGICVPEEGIVYIGNGNTIETGESATARLVAFLPQFERLGFALTAFEYVLLGRIPHVRAFSMPSAKDDSAVERALSNASADALAGRFVNELSGGELQLVRIARCLAQDTPVIVMDEPTAMLDPAHSLMIADAIRALTASGHTIVFSTHDPALAAYAASDVVLMRDGRVLFRGTAADALEPGRLESCFGVAFGCSRAPSVFRQRS